MRARRAAERAEKAQNAEERRAKVLDGVASLDEAESREMNSALPNADGVLDVERLINLLMIACRVEGGVHEWLHQSCDDRQDRILAELIEEQEFAREVMAEAKRYERTIRLMRQRLDEVDPEGPFGPKEFVSVLLKKWESE
jgi:hypothetical protein